MRLPLLFDGWGQAQLHEGKSVEDDIRTLEKMGGLDKGDPEPPLLTIEGALPHDESRAPNNRWVIESIEWGEAIRRADGHRIRQACEVTLLEHTEDDRLQRIKPRVTSPRYRPVRVRKGDTFERIARRELGTRRLGVRLARLNGSGRSPDRPLKPGRTIRVPTGDLLAKWKSDLKRRR